jgi:hypothetical protein
MSLLTLSAFLHYALTPEYPQPLESEAYRLGAVSTSLD